MNVLPTLLAAAGLASVHVFSQRLRILDGVPRSWFLSVAGGMAVAFVVLRLLPALGQGQETLSRTVDGTPFSFLQSHVYLAVLFSMIVFYGADGLAMESKEENQQEGEGESTGVPVFWLNLSVFATMNALIGYLLLHNQERSLQALVLFFIAMTLKFIVNDHALHSKHQEKYDNLGRWLLAGAVFLGWEIRYLSQFPEYVPIILQALLAGAVSLNVLREELPPERKSRYWAFGAGAIVYSALLLAF
ncbi:MAG: hypothetical protein AB1941_01125 [Gemmatimonadota bacterium]